MGVILRGKPTDGLALPLELLTDILPAAPAEYAVVFLYACGRCAQNGAVSLGELAEGLSKDLETVQGAMRYFREQGFVQWEEPGEDLALLLGEPERPVGAAHYPPEELAKYLERSSELRRLFSLAEKLLGRLLTHGDMEVLFGLYDWLHLPIPVLETLVRYCRERGVRSLTYLERVAISWSEAGVDTPEKAAAYLERFTDGCREVRRAFGIRDRSLTPTEEAYIKKWRQEWGLGLELLTQACEKTVLQTGKISFPYADKILESWHDAGIRDASEIEKLDNKKPVPVSDRTANRAAAKNKFINFEQRDLDFDKLSERKQNQWKREKKD